MEDGNVFQRPHRVWFPAAITPFLSKKEMPGSADIGRPSANVVAGFLSPLTVKNYVSPIDDAGNTNLFIINVLAKGIFALLATSKHQINRHACE
jgi:hypothetical protein